MKTMQPICCALGGILIGFFANQLKTGTGVALFALGIILVVSSVVINNRDSNK